MLRVVTDDEGRAEMWAALDEIVLDGARRMLAAALEAEVDAYLAAFAEHRDERGHRLVVRNGRAKSRTITTAAGPIEVSAPRVDDRRVDDAGERQRFRSSILTPWARKSPKVTEVLPLMYLHGMSSGDFAPALAGFFGSAAGLSASVITRLTTQWQAEQRAFAERDLSDRDYVYVWADGVHFNVRLDEERLCCLVIVGVRVDGTKELVAIAAGHRESTESWADLLRDLKRRGMRAPVLAVGDGALGFWGALRDVFPQTRAQRCWVHKVANVINALPTSVQPTARRMLAEIRDAEDRDHAVRATRSPSSSAPSGPRRSPRSSTTPNRCSPSTTSRPSTGSTSRPRTRLSRRSRRCGCGPKSPRDPDPRPPASRWRSSSSSPRNNTGGQSTGLTSSLSFEPVQPSTRG